MNQSEAPIVVVSDTLEGGAAAATNRLVDGLSRRGLPLERWHFTAGSRETPVVELSLDPRPKRPAFERILKNLSRRAAGSLRHRRHEVEFLARVAAARPRVINIHNIHDSGLDHESLLRLPASLPLVWTLHDCWPFRPESFEWSNSARGCVESTSVDQPLGPARERRARFLSQRPGVVWVAPSRWIASELRRHAPAGARVHQIPYGVDCEGFQPLPRQAAVRELGLDPGRLWIGYSSTWVSTRKGTDILPEALARVDTSRLGLLAWGEPPEYCWPRSLEVKVVGRASGAAALSKLYSACDLFVCPSRADNLPNAVLESLACGTPVIGSDAGGIPDMVRPGITGWLYHGDAPGAFAEALHRALADRSGWAELRDRCRRAALEDYALDLQATRYAALFDEVGRLRA